MKKNIDNVKLGKDVKIYDFVNLYDCTIGDYSKIGAFVEIQKNAIIGTNCKISSHTFICAGVNIKDNVFVGHNVTFINDNYSRAVNINGALQTEDDWKVVKTMIEDCVSIGSSATILAGIKIGKNSVVGAGAVVTKDVPPDTVVAGVPAKVIRKLK